MWDRSVLPKSTTQVDLEPIPLDVELNAFPNNFKTTLKKTIPCGVACDLFDQIKGPSLSFP